MGVQKPNTNDGKRLLLIIEVVFYMYNMDDSLGSWPQTCPPGGYDSTRQVIGYKFAETCMNLFAKTFVLLDILNQ